MICIFLKSNDYFSYIYVVVGLSFHMAHPVISDLNRDSSKCLTRRILRRICKGLGGFGCGTRGTTLAPASIELFYCYPERTAQIIINIYLEKQTQAVNLNSGRGWDEEPMAMAMGLLVIEKQIVCVHCRVHRDSSGGRQKWNTCPLNIHICWFWTQSHPIRSWKLNRKRFVAFKLEKQNSQVYAVSSTT